MGYSELMAEFEALERAFEWDSRNEQRELVPLRERTDNMLNRIMAAVKPGKNDEHS